MLMRLGALVTLCLFVGVCTAQEKPAANVKQLSGDWLWDSTHKQSDAKPEVILERIVISADTLTFHYRMGDQPWTTATKFKLDETSTPKKIDFVPVAGATKGHLYRGLFELDGDRLRICYRGPSSTRPKDFKDTALGNESTYFIFLKTTAAAAQVQP